MLEEVLAPAFSERPHVQARWRVELAQIARQERDFNATAAHLDAAQALLESPDSADARWDADTRFFLAGGRVLLALQLGAPDLAAPHLEAARAAAAELDDPNLAIDQNFFELSVANAMLRPAAGLEVWRRFEREHSGREFAPSKLARNRLRAAQSAVDLVASDGAHVEQARALLDAVGEPSSLPRSEAASLGQLRATLALDLGDGAGALREIERVREALAQGGGALREREEQLAALASRASRSVGVPAEDLARLRDELEGYFAAALDVWRALPPRSGGVGPLRYRERREVLGELIFAHCALAPGEAGRRRAFESVLAVQAVGSTAREVGAGAASLEQVQRELLGPRRGALFFLPTRRELHVLALDGETITHYALQVPSATLDQARAELLACIGRARAIDSEQHSAELEASRRALSALMFDSALLARIAAWERVAIVAPETLGYLPFELLLANDGRELGAAHAVSYWPSFPLALWIARERPAPARRALAELDARLIVCSDPGPDAGSAVERLPFGAREREALLGEARFPALGEHLRVSSGAQVTATALGEAAGAADFLHVLTHARRDGLGEQPLRLVLWGGAEVGLSELEALRFPALTVFTACGAQSGQLRRGDDGRHRLSSALVLGGARASVLSELDVDYDFALEFLGRFHGQLLGLGADVDEALRAARASYAGESSTRARYEPFLFHAWGLADFSPALAEAAPERPAAPIRPLWTWIGAAGVLVVLAVLVVRRRRAS